MLSTDILDRIYEAAVLPDGWPSILGDVATGVGAQGGLLIAIDDERARFAGSPEALTVAQDFAAGGYMSRSDRIPRLIARQHPGFEIDLDFYTLEQMDKEPIYTEFLRPRGWHFAAATSLRSHADSHLILTVEGFTEATTLRGAVAPLDRLRPHLARSAILAAQLRLEQARGMVAALDLVGLPAAALNGQRVIAANALMQARLDSGEIAGAGARLQLGAPGLDALLQQALHEAGEPTAHGASIALPRAGEPCREVVHVLPLRGDARDIFTGISALVIFASVDDRPLIPAAMLQDLFGLTAAEAAIAQGLAAGKSIATLSGQTGRSEHTLKTQLKAVLGKVGVNRQADLVRTMADLCIRVPHGAPPRLPGHG